MDGHKGLCQREKVRKTVANPEFQFPTAEMCDSICLNSIDTVTDITLLNSDSVLHLYTPPSLQPLLFEHGGVEMPQNSARLPKKKMSIIIIVFRLYFIIVVLNKLHKLCLAHPGKCQNICYFRSHEVNNRPFPQQWKTTAVIWWINNSEPACIILGPCNQSIETHFSQNQFLFIPPCLFPTVVCQNVFCGKEKQNPKSKNFCCISYSTTSGKALAWIAQHSNL